MADFGEWNEQAYLAEMERRLKMNTPSRSPHRSIIADSHERTLREANAREPGKYHFSDEDIVQAVRSDLDISQFTTPYDGDGRIDLAVYRPSTGVWYILTSSYDYQQFWAVSWGAPGDVPIPGVYTNPAQQQTQPAVFRPSTGTWLIREALPARIPCDDARPECYVEEP